MLRETRQGPRRGSGDTKLRAPGLEGFRPASGEAREGTLETSAVVTACPAVLGARRTHPLSAAPSRGLLGTHLGPTDCAWQGREQSRTWRSGQAGYLGEEGQAGLPGGAWPPKEGV